MTRGDEGQAATELALVLPFFVLLLLGVVQVTLVARDQILVVHAAREGAREAAVDDRPGVARRAALRSAGSGSGGLKPDRLTAETSSEKWPSATVTVEVRYRSATEVVLIGPLVPDIYLRAKATMRQESEGKTVDIAAIVRKRQEPLHHEANSPD